MMERIVIATPDLIRGRNPVHRSPPWIASSLRFSQ
jgi:hypothetical protein